MRTMVLLLACAFFCFGGGGCKNRSSQPPSKEAIDAMSWTPVKVKIMSDGRLIVDGVTATLDQFQGRIDQCDPKKVVIWYYRDDPDAPEPPPIAMKVIDIIMQRGIAVSFSSKPDFRDVIDGEGRSHPRP